MRSRHQIVILKIAAVVSTLFASDFLRAKPAVYLGQPCKQTNRPSAAEMDHGIYDALLKKYVDADGLVAYGKWKGNAADLKVLDDYLIKLGCVDFDKSAPKAAKIAFWINAYNAVTIKGILREYPTSSIQNHTSKNGGYHIWKDLQLWVDGKAFCLDEMENKILRKVGEPKIHFGIVCAARGCPPLANRAYTAENLEKTLEANARTFFARSKNFQENANSRTVYVSKLLEWYGKDFAATAQQQILLLHPYLPAGLDWLKQGDFTVEYLPYDWALNDQNPQAK